MKRPAAAILAIIQNEGSENVSNKRQFVSFTPSHQLDGSEPAQAVQVKFGVGASNEPPSRSRFLFRIFLVQLTNQAASIKCEVSKAKSAFKSIEDFAQDVTSFFIEIIGPLYLLCHVPCHQRIRKWHRTAPCNWIRSEEGTKCHAIMYHQTTLLHFFLVAKGNLPVDGAEVTGFRSRRLWMLCEFGVMTMFRPGPAGDRAFRATPPACGTSGTPELLEAGLQGASENPLTHGPL
ncbi:hypothetical protein CEXT_65221 [Caerostris extrusa]|uniref:Uncharacterized protein n=1 Tax=Caerostris extrusa TaxID=172846 RepID=A0AAV4SB40_CAEEX|nr:hypothetical protein CEXT_65221 [Caerostris extrusa]